MHYLVRFIYELIGYQKQKKYCNKIHEYNLIDRGSRLLSTEQS